MGAGMATVGCFLAFAPILMLFTGDFSAEMLVLIPIGLALAWFGLWIEEGNHTRHTNDYGKVARCPRCGSTRVYAMTFDDKRASVAFWGIASSKIGKRYHCDNCGTEW